MDTDAAAVFIEDGFREGGGDGKKTIKYSQLVSTLRKWLWRAKRLFDFGVTEMKKKNNSALHGRVRRR